MTSEKVTGGKWLKHSGSAERFKIPINMSCAIWVPCLWENRWPLQWKKDYINRNSPRGSTPRPMPKEIKKGINEGYNTLDNYRLWV